MKTLGAGFPAVSGAVGVGTDGGWAPARNNPAAGGGLRQHYFVSATQPMWVNTGDQLLACVNPDPTNPPRMIMLQWNDGNWEHRAYWGEDKFSYGRGYAGSKRWLGPLPPAGVWTRLEVPAGLVGLEGRAVHGLAFTLFDGAAAWDHAGRSSAPLPSDLVWVGDRKGVSSYDWLVLA